MRSTLIRTAWILLAVSALALSACATATRSESLRVRLYNYAAAIRWNDIDQAIGYVDPAVFAAKPFTDADHERWQKVQVSRYFEGPQGTDAQGRVVQTVQIELIDRATQSVRTIVDHQRWRYDDTAKTWWLESGLPQL